MEYKVLYLFVEGPDDERFFRSVIEPLIGERFDFVKYILYAQQSKEDFEKLIPTSFTSKTDFMIEILKIFSTQTASEQNPSFSYLLKKLETILQ